MSNKPAVACIICGKLIIDTPEEQLVHMSDCSTKQSEPQQQRMSESYNQGGC